MADAPVQKDPTPSDVADAHQRALVAWLPTTEPDLTNMSAAAAPDIFVRNDERILARMLVQPPACLVIENDRERVAHQQGPTQCRTGCRRIHTMRTARPPRKSTTMTAMTSNPITPIVPPPPTRPIIPLIKPPLIIQPIIRTMNRLEIRINARTAAVRTATTMTRRRSPSSIVREAS